MNISDYLDGARARMSFKSDNILARHLEIHSGNLSRYRKGYALPGEDTMLRLAYFCGIPAEQALIDLATWRAEGEAAVIWKALARRLRTAQPAPSPKLTEPPEHAMNNV